MLGLELPPEAAACRKEPIEMTRVFLQVLATQRGHSQSVNEFAGKITEEKKGRNREVITDVEVAPGAAAAPAQADAMSEAKPPGRVQSPPPLSVGQQRQRCQHMLNICAQLSLCRSRVAYFNSKSIDSQTIITV